MTRGQRNRFEGRTTLETISIRTFTKNGTEIARVVARSKAGAVIEFWTRKVTELSDKAFKRQTVVNA